MSGRSEASPWSAFARTLMLSVLLGLLGLYGAILLIDPYDVLPFSPDWHRFPVSRHARDYNAVLARKPEYDSAVLGNSTSMLLYPPELNRAFRGRFVMLSMPAASPYEQRLLLQLFARHHPAVRTLILGLDASWCHARGAPRFQGLMRDHAFPYWLYDENPWNDLPPLNVKTFKDARRQFQALIGWRIRYPQKPDGYWDFSEALHARNDLESVRARLRAAPKRLLELGPKGAPPRFPDLDALEPLLKTLPPDARKILFFAPAHQSQLPAPGTDQMEAWRNCKARAGALAQRVPNTLVADFNFPSPITEDDGHFLDEQHYTRAIASRLVRRLHQTWTQPAGRWDDVRVLGRSGLRP